MDDLDDLLARIDALDNVLPDGFVFEARDKIFDDRKCDVGLQQSDANFAANGHNIVFAKRAFAS